MRIRNFFLLASTIFCLLTIASARGDDEKSSSIAIKWVDVYGKIQKGPSVRKIAWTWSRPKEEENYESPSLRVWLTNSLPKNLTIEKVTGDGTRFVEAFDPKNSEFMVLDIRSLKSVIRFHFSDPNGKKSEMTLLIEILVNKPYLLIHPRCADKSVKVHVRQSVAKHLFVALNCVESDDTLDLYFFRSQDTSWNTDSGLVQFDPENKFMAFRYTAPMPKESNIYTTLLYRVGTKDDAGNATAYEIYYVPKVAPNKLYTSAGLGVSYYIYKEKIDDIQINQMSVTGKANLGYRLIPRVLDVAMNVFGNIVTIYNNPTPAVRSDDVPIGTAQFYGVNGRLGYRLPISLGATEFMFLAGWYLWGMFTPQYSNDKIYGVDRLSGPQLFLSFSNAQAGHRRIYAYFKFAFISESLSSFGNGLEIAGGGGFDLFPKETKSWAMTLDIANASYNNEFNGLNLLSITLGVQKPF